MNGFFLIDKPKNWTSFDVCAKIKKILREKKVGHTGTLDPFATGLLLVATGKFTKLIPFFERAKKKYRAEILFGKSSATLDPESEIFDAEIPQKISQKKMEQILQKNFYGKILQRPPLFSAIKIGGKKMCDAARAGEKIEIPPRPTEIFSSKILNFDFPKIGIEILAAAGFYVRSFARDIGEKCGTSAICTNLRREKIGEISVENAQKIENFAENPRAISLEKILPLPILEIPKNRIPDFSAGRAFFFEKKITGKILIFCENSAVGVGEICGKNLQPRIVF